MIAGQMTALVLLLSPALALDSGWADTEGGRMRLVVDPSPRADGTIAGFLDIDLEPGWKTYWRDPGGAGIPPTLDFSSSRGVALSSIAYPPPVRVDDGYAIWAGYTAPVQFPLVLERTGSGDASIRASVFIGICEKICVPFQAELAVELPALPTADDMDAAAVAAAFDRLPDAAAADFGLETVSLDAASGELVLIARLPAFRPSGVAPDLFVAGPEGYAFAPPKLTGIDDKGAEWRVRVELPSGETDRPKALPLDVVLTLGQRAIEQEVEAAPMHIE